MAEFDQQNMATLMTKHPLNVCTDFRGMKLSSSGMTFLTFVPRLTLTSASQAPQQSPHSALSNLLPSKDMRGIKKINGRDVIRGLLKFCQCRQNVDNSG